ncbi:MAG: penicillin-binding protein 2 [Prevotellaceae bacterium]|nr:penicillin-binding protein 2 [Prevotellaceae bacterium]
MRNDLYINRKYTIGAMAVVVIVAFLAQLFLLQVVDYDKYLTIAGNNALIKNMIIPDRGLLYDRNGEVLVYNRAAYDVMVTVNDVKPFDTLDFCRSVNITPEFLRQKFAEVKDKKKNKGYSEYTPQVLIMQLSKEENGSLQEKLWKFPGFKLRPNSVREYSYSYAGHLLGSTGEVSQNKLEKDNPDNYYMRGDYAGQSGIELAYEKILRGKKGFTIEMRDNKMRIVTEKNDKDTPVKYEDGQHDKLPVSGENLTLTVDILLQAYGEKLLQGKRGAIVAIEPSTGEILAMVSNPTFDPSTLIGRQRSKNYKKLEIDPLKPLLNRATKGRYSPGSTFKPLQALVCLQEGGITENSLFPCNGVGSSPIKCTHSHGSPVELLRGIEQSCNPYFWGAFRSTLEKDGYGKDNADFKNSYNQWREDVMSFGYGEKFDSDIDADEQDRGNVPSESFFNRMFGEKGWRALTIRSLSIGQGEVSCTPLQMANLAATIANRGHFYTPHVARMGDYAKEKHTTNVEEKYFSPVVEGMRRVCLTGTARWYNIKDVIMCGKTGTVQNNHGKDHSMFIGFAPMDNPKIAIAVVIENAGFGASWAYPIGSLMMEKYLNRNISVNRLWLEEKMLKTYFVSPTVTTN